MAASSILVSATLCRAIIRATAGWFASKSLATRGVLFIDGDHRENIIHSEEGVDSTYVGRQTETGFLTSNASGNWALGNYWGPLGEETRSWLDFLSTSKQGPHTSAREARTVLEVTAAIERAAETKEIVTLSPGGGNVG